ncbi:MAG: alpha/beta hydrolase [Thermomicrobiales bacterium]
MATLQDWYAQESHQPYTRDCADAVGDAFLIHGFLGSPAETRPIGDLILSRGLNVTAPLVPGMAGDILNLNQITAADWTTVIGAAWEEFCARSSRRVLVGHSLGGALALYLAATSPTPPDLMILLAPFTRIGDWRGRVLQIGKLFVSEVSFYSNLDLDNSETREWFGKTMPGLDLDDPEIVNTIKHDSAVSTETLDQLRRLAGNVRKASGNITVPTVILQGHWDNVVWPQDTRWLAGNLKGLLEYHEFPGNHFLPFTSFDSWDDVQHLVDRALIKHFSGVFPG